MSLEIYGTLGPSCCTQQMIESLLKEGMTGMRLNLSHCNLDDRKDWIDAFHQACDALYIKADLMMDMQGPELRTLNTSPITFQKEDEIVFALHIHFVCFIIYALPCVNSDFAAIKSRAKHFILREGA